MARLAVEISISVLTNSALHRLMKSRLMESRKEIVLEDGGVNLSQFRGIMLPRVFITH